MTPLELRRPRVARQERLLKGECEPDICEVKAVLPATSSIIPSQINDEGMDSIANLTSTWPQKT